jgi:transposase
MILVKKVLNLRVNSFKAACCALSHKPLIMNWFKAKRLLSSGVLEGLNLNAKLTSRKAYGFKSQKCLK